MRGPERLRETGKCCTTPVHLWRLVGMAGPREEGGTGPGRPEQKGAALAPAMVSQHPNLFHLAVSEINFSGVESVLPTAVAGKQPP